MAVAAASDSRDAARNLLRLDVQRVRSGSASSANMNLSAVGFERQIGCVQFARYEKAMIGSAESQSSAEPST
eukprot:5774217-Prymnesium_polylepis.2